MKNLILSLSLSVLMTGCACVSPEPAAPKQLTYVEMVKVMEAGWSTKDSRVQEESCTYKDGVKQKNACTYDFSHLISAAEAGEISIPPDFSLTPKQRADIFMKIYFDLYNTAIERAGLALAIGQPAGCPERIDPAAQAGAPADPQGGIRVSCGRVIDVEIPEDIPGFIGEPYPVEL